MESTDRVELIRRFGCIHKAIHGDGRWVLERIVTTCEQMLRDRGCIRVERCEDDLCETILDGSMPVMQGWYSSGARIALYVHAEDRVGVRFARMAIEREMSRPDDPCELVIVSPEGPTPFTRKECEGKGVQFIPARSVCQNVLRHALVPKHERVETGPHNVRREHLPRILDTDAIVQYHNWPLGTIVKIERNFGGNEPSVYFRVVSPGNI